jgi:hypothetical protein
VQSKLHSHHSGRHELTNNHVLLDFDGDSVRSHFRDQVRTLCAAMTSSLDSTAVFESRCKEMGLPDATMLLLTAASLNSFSRMAFCCNFSPGQPDEKPLVDVLTAALNGAPDIGTLSILRRLFYESHTLAMSDLRQRIERTDETKARPVAGPERVQRMANQKLKLPDFDLTGELEPCHSLLDEVEQQREDGMIRHITLDRCGSRLSELAGCKKDPKIKLDLSGGLIKITQHDVVTQADVSSDLRVHHAFTRRALAYDQSELVSFKTSMAWCDHLLTLLHAPAMDNFAAISLTQIMNADRKIFQLVSEATRSNIRADAQGIRPCDASFAAMRNDPRVSFLLLPIPGRSSTSAGPSNVGTKRKNPPQVQNAPWWERDGARAKGTSSSSDPKGKGKGKYKGKDKGKGAKTNAPSTVAIPDELKTMAQVDDDGKFLCWNFNLAAGCQYAKAGGRCRRGRHVCCKPGCLGEHSLQECTKQ